MFGSDNQSGVPADVMAAILAANTGRMPSYGDDEITKRAEELVKQAFETEDLDFYIVTTGGAANGLALGAICPSWGAVLCQTHSHIVADEGSGPELFTGGARLVAIDGVAGKLVPNDLQWAAKSYSKDFVHGPQIKAVSISNLNENGETYSPNEIAALSKVARENDWLLHCDGARFANAVQSLGASPSAISWRGGIDALSFGLTKNGALMAEAVILFGSARTIAAPYMRKRAGQLVSKHRYLAAQFVAMLEDGLWLKLAKNANEMAQKLSEVFEKSGHDLAAKCQGNEVFVDLSDEIAQKLRANGIVFYDWPALNAQTRRFVCSWETNSADLMALADLL